MEKFSEKQLLSCDNRDHRDDKSTPYARIIAAALVCMEERGIESTGIRDIARQAGVNSAAINYYFRSKSNLIRIAMEQSLEWTFGEIINALDTLTEDGMPQKEALIAAFSAFAADLHRAPRLSYAHLRDALVNQSYDGPAVQRGIEFLKQLEKRISPNNPACDRETLRLHIVQIWSNLMLTAMLPKLYDPFVSLKLEDDKYRAKYMRQLFHPLFSYLDSM